MTIYFHGYLKCMGAQYFWVLTIVNSGFLKLWVLKMCEFSQLWILRIAFWVLCVGCSVRQSMPIQHGYHKVQQPWFPLLKLWFCELQHE